MSSKRDHSDFDDGEFSSEPEPQPKRAKQPSRTNKSSKSSRQHQNSGIDSTWGQKYVFSNYADATTIPAGEESEFEDDTDAMAYLMSVRQEAQGIPHLLVAPKVQIGPQLPAGLEHDGSAQDDQIARDNRTEDDENGEVSVDRSIYHDRVAEEGGWYEDGAYIAGPEEEPDAGDDSSDQALDKAIQDAYFASILQQYINLRTVLTATPTTEALSRLPSSMQLEAAPFTRNSSTTSLWSRLLHTTDPNPVQLAILTKDSVLRILRVMLGGKFLRRGHVIDERTSRWLWALLGRLPERGELDHTEIGWVRDLGRRAVLLGRSLAEMAALRDELHDGGLGVNEGVDRSSSDEDVVADAEVSYDDDRELVEGDCADVVNDSVGPDTEAVAEQTKPPDSPDDLEEGECEDDGDAAMDIGSDSSVEEGETTDDAAAGLEDAKARLLAQLDESAAEQERIAAAEAARVRERMNMRATLNMVLTVAGEFYGQRDLLEFREPFLGM